MTGDVVFASEWVSASEQEEIKILFHFPNADKTISLRTLVEETGIEKKELKDILDKLASKGTISKKGNKFGLIPLAPGVFEKYYLAREDKKTKIFSFTKQRVIYNYYRKKK